MRSRSLARYTAERLAAGAACRHCPRCGGV